MVKLYNNIVLSNNYKLTNLNDIGFVTTFSFKEFSDSKVSAGALDLIGSGIGGELIVSSKLVISNGNPDLLKPSYIRNNLSNQVINFENIYVIEVSLDLDRIDVDVQDFNQILKPVSGISNSYYENILDCRGKEFKFHYIKCHLNYFLNNIKDIVSLGLIPQNEPNLGKKYINISPIIIFRCGLSWSNIISLIQLQNIVVHGGSVSRRHKISLNEYKLSVFLFLSGLTGSVEQFYDSYVDKFFSSSKLEPDLYAFKQINQNLVDFIPSQEILLNYYLLNKQIRIIIELEGVKKSIMSLEETIAKLNSYISQESDKYLERLEYEKDQNEKKLSQLKSKDLKFASSKHKTVVRHKMQNLKTICSEIQKKIEALELNLSEGYTEKTESLNKLAFYNTKFLELKQKLSDISSEAVSIPKSKGVKSISLLPVNSFLTGSQTRKYHSLILKREISSSSTPQKLSFQVDSPAYIELGRYLNNFPVSQETQIKIEKYLFKQGEIFYNAKLEELLDVNYFKLNPSVLNILKNSISDLDRLINNYKKKCFKL